MIRLASVAVAAAPRTLTVAALATLTLITASSCTDGSPSPNPPSVGSVAPSVAPSAAPSAAAEETEARMKAVEAYDNFRKAQVAASAQADVSGGDVDKYAADPLLSEIRNDLYFKQQQGLVTKGTPKWSVEVTNVNVAVRPFTVTLRDCFDATGWHTVFKKSGKSAAVPGQAKKYLVRAEAVQYDDGRWLIGSAKADRDRPC